MAGGHRCSLRHNVCHPATDAYTNIYNCKIYQRGKYMHVVFLEIYFINTPLLYVVITTKVKYSATICKYTYIVGTICTRRP